jgi:O-antigen/teichoic acid export membrane protein
MSVRLSLAWTYLAQGLIFLVAFGSSVVIARLVTPRDFGIFAMAAAITTILNLFMQFGLAKFIMRQPQVDRDLLRSLFTVNTALTLVYVGALVAGSAFASTVANSPEVGEFLLVFALFPLIALFEFVPSALCAREMRFGLIAGISVLRAVVLATSTIVLAVMGFAYMSFAWAAVMAWLATTLAYNACCWRPDIWRLRFIGFRSIFQFGAEMVGIGGFNQLGSRAGEMALGSILGLPALGIYTRASGLPTQIYTNIYGAGSNVIFARLSRELRDTGGFADTYVRFMRLILGLLWPAMFGLAVLAQPLVNIVYGPKWQAAALPLSLLTIALAVTLAIGMSSEVFVLRHETRRQMKIESIRAGAGFLLFIGGAMISLPMAAGAKLVEALLAWLLYRRPMDRMVGGSVGQLRRVYLESLILGVATILPALLVMQWFSWSPRTPLPVVAGTILAGGLLWTALLIALRHPLVDEARRAAQKLIR